MRIVFKFLLLTLIATNCKYSPSGSNYNELSDEIDPITYNISITPSLEVNDTIKVSGGININYNFDIGDKELDEFRMWLDEDSSRNLANASWHELKETIWFDTRHFDDGLHSLNFKVKTSTGTESITDKMRLNRVEWKVTMPIWFDNAEVSSVPVTSIERRDGSLKIEWEKYERPNFQNYNLWRGSYNIINNFESHYSVNNDRKENQSFNSVFDAAYIGGVAHYQIYVLDNNHNGAASTPVKYEDSYPQIIKADTVNNQIRLTWSQCRYPSNFGEYKLENRYSNDSWTFDNISDTTFTDVLYTGANEIEYILTTIPSYVPDPRATIFDEFTLQ